ncbi:hypothetical protein AN478_06375 [Thiohalorhabdus denitrificans]|uniref:Protein-tyrosine-phosphatase n=1 Tax=Thiohalorhabdus denitrificans TaxID=381306 RepID=A0A0P9CMV4_9GAMM|nr:hypothetical protein [Thiohalorhabdus denitrificans]KPV40417.1 hypothetical protein AN478_06375 [Thiohalorhabdus denitrificans]SCY60244.1 hypothetical protein SAMN05661077_2638 [Thiohalorhabdus denitrificans]
MFKRKARILFLDPGQGALARVAAAWAAHVGTRWVEAGAGALGERDDEMPDGEDVPGPGPEVVSWSGVDPREWDLIVPLVVDRKVDWEGYLSGLRQKRWDLVAECGRGPSGEAPDPQACHEALRHRAEGLVGGFRMKAREDQSGMDT